uniref:Alkylhydroperoxidase AhpD n=1 Tax=uncultured Flavobacteriia bacterium TaxID=212695 RepID=H6RDT5_9BACT|nr:alkylhydroperoxidase [uncultured bacterium]CCF99196.1 Alkylhydroperoxidase AhpD [uncultured Flavobacteriia bacterium]
MALKNTNTENPSRFKIVEYEDASPRVQAIYDDTKKSLQLPFVLNWFKCQGNNATLLEGNWTKLKTTLVEGEVPSLLKHLIIYNVSSKKRCEYCTHAHGAFADSMGKVLNDDASFRVSQNMDSDIIPKSYKTAITIVSKAALEPRNITHADFEELQHAGFDDVEIQELMAQADLVNMLNTIADVCGIQIDNELLELKA